MKSDSARHSGCIAGVRSSTSLVMAEATCSAGVNPEAGACGPADCGAAATAAPEGPAAEDGPAWAVPAGASLLPRPPSPVGAAP
eukprot:283235-Chlamydomonas_euryale.AAC.1